jgi:hypothetical protein
MAKNEIHIEKCKKKSFKSSLPYSIYMEKQNSIIKDAKTTKFLKRENSRFVSRLEDKANYKKTLKAHQRNQ